MSERRERPHLARADRELIEAVGNEAWRAVWLFLDAEPFIGAEVAGNVAAAAMKAAEAALRVQLEDA